MDIPDASKEYLEEFISFARKNLPYEPVIVGGWAVYCFTKKQKSIDVDVLLKSGRDIELLKPFFSERKFSLHKDSDENITFELETAKYEYKGIAIESIIFSLPQMYLRQGFPLEMSFSPYNLPILTPVSIMGRKKNSF